MGDLADDSDRSDAEEFELERAYDRGELAAVFREFAAAFESGRPIRLDGDERSVRVAVPDRVVAELEAEHEPDSTPPVTELELELEWDDEAGSSLRFVDRDATDGSDGGAEGTDAEPAAAVLSLEGVTDGSRAAADADEADVTAEDGPGVDGTADSGRTSRFEVYEDNAGEWRWRLVHWNGNVVADGGEGYASRSNAERAARSVMRSAPTATIERLE